MCVNEIGTTAKRQGRQVISHSQIRLMVAEIGVLFLARHPTQRLIVRLWIFRTNQVQLFINLGYSHSGKTPLWDPWTETLICVWCLTCLAYSSVAAAAAAPSCTDIHHTPPVGWFLHIPSIQRHGWVWDHIRVAVVRVPDLTIVVNVLCKKNISFFSFRNKKKKNAVICYIKY